MAPLLPLLLPLLLLLVPVRSKGAGKLMLEKPRWWDWETCVRGPLQGVIRGWLEMTARAWTRLGGPSRAF